MSQLLLLLPVEGVGEGAGPPGAGRAGAWWGGDSTCIWAGADFNQNFPTCECMTDLIIEDLHGCWRGYKLSTATGVCTGHNKHAAD